MINLLKMEFGWGFLKKEDIVDYVPSIISTEDFKDITCEDYSEG